MISTHWRLFFTGFQIEWQKYLSARTAWMETLGMSAVVPLLGYGINKADPLFLNYRFPWLILVPLLISLRYGFFCGIGSALFLATTALVALQWHWAGVSTFPVEIVVGMLMMTLIAAEFHDKWQQKIQPLHNKYHYLRQRMNEFSRAYFILKGSHAQLEQQVASHSKSMRTSLNELQQKLQRLESYQGEPLHTIAEQILELFSEYGHVQTGSVYPVAEGQKLSLHPIARWGNPPSFWPSNPLVREAFKSGNVTSIKNFDDEISQDVLIAVPLVDVFHKVWGMVIINEMPFFAMQENTLDLLSLLGGYIGDLIQRRTEANRSRKDKWSECEYELRRALREMRHLKIDSAIVVSVVEKPEVFNSLLATFHAELRGIDKIFSFKDGNGRQAIINVLPLTDGNGLMDFLARLNLINCLSHSVSDRLVEYTLDDKAEDVHTGISTYTWIVNENNPSEKAMPMIAQLCQPTKPDYLSANYVRTEISA